MVLDAEVGVVVREGERSVVNVDTAERARLVGNSRYREDLPGEELSLVLGDVLLSSVMSVREESEDAES